MVGFLKLSQHRASGTSLVTLVFTGIAGTLAYAAQCFVDFGAAFLLAATAIFSARAGARFSHSLPEAKLRRYYGAFLIFIAISMVLKPWLPHVSIPLSYLHRGTIRSVPPSTSSDSSAWLWSPRSAGTRFKLNVPRAPAPSSSLSSSRLHLDPETRPQCLRR